MTFSIIFESLFFLIVKDHINQNISDFGLWPNKHLELELELSHP